MLPMFYESITALNTTAHHDAFLEPVKDYSFAKKSSTIAVGVSEFVQASYEYPVIFIRNDDNAYCTNRLKRSDKYFCGGGWRALVR